uniref:Fibronectin type-III domain-containing protein n=1 Tax=Gasterosteus aculeatus aculeatus TaxID=481459 RepID=A0AAQ4NT56_GASAC
MLLVYEMCHSSGSACEPPSTPECFKRRIEDTFFICEWSTKTNNPNVTFDIHIGEKKFNTSKTTCSILQEVIIIYHPVDIWVEARVGNSSCVSTNRSVVLSRIVKSEAPQNIGMSWSKNNLKLNWTAAGYPVLCEVLFRRSDYLTWENVRPIVSPKHLTLTNLSKDSVYLLQVRCRYNGPKKDLVSLWSDWRRRILHTLNSSYQFIRAIFLLLFQCNVNQKYFLWQTNYESVSVTDLTDYVRYLFFEHKRADGKPQTVKMCFFYQKEGVPRKEPQDLTSLTETKTSANLSWKEIPSADQRGFLTHYTLSLCNCMFSHISISSECRNISASVTEHYVENLLPGGKYDIVLAGVTRAGKGPEATVTISTLPEDSWMHDFNPYQPESGVRN